MKTKRFYEKPSMQVFEFRQQPQLLIGSASGSADLSGAGVNEDEDYTEW